MTWPGSVLLNIYTLNSASLLQVLLALLGALLSQYFSYKFMETHPSVSSHLRIISSQETWNKTQKQTNKNCSFGL